MSKSSATTKRLELEAQEDAAIRAAEAQAAKTAVPETVPTPAPPPEKVQTALERDIELLEWRVQQQQRIRDLAMAAERERAVSGRFKKKGDYGN